MRSITVFRFTALSGLIFAMVCNAFAQRIVPSLQWETHYKDFSCELNHVTECDDGGYLLGGRIYDIADEPIQNDCILLKIDGEGMIQWSKVFGGIGNEFIKGLQPTIDGGYVFVANTNSPSSQLDYSWVVKLDGEGNKLWELTIEGMAAAILQNMEGEYLVAGESAWLATIDSGGNNKGTRFLSTDARVHAVIQSSDGGLVLAGIKGLGSSHYGDSDGCLIKISAEGLKQWEHAFGGTEFDFFSSVEESHEGGFIAAGRSSSPPSGNKQSNQITPMDYWVVKVDAQGNRIWDRSFGMDPLASPNIRRADQGYVFNTGSHLVKIDSEGDLQWDYSLASPDQSEGSYKIIIQDFERTADSGFIVCASSWDLTVGVPAFGCDSAGWAAKLEPVVYSAAKVVTWQWASGVFPEAVEVINGDWNTNIAAFPVGSARAMMFVPALHQQRYFRLRAEGRSNTPPALSFGEMLTWPTHLNQKLEFSPTKNGPWTLFTGDQRETLSTHYAIVPDSLRDHYFRTRKIEQAPAQPKP